MRASVAILTTVAILSGATSHATTFESGETQASLIELYTSEGCSSCPAAEARLTKLRDNPGLWTLFVPVAFHVDYWDNLGWPDRFASGVFTQRQNHYAARVGRRPGLHPRVCAQRPRRHRADPRDHTGRLRVDVKPDNGIAVSFRIIDPSAVGLVIEVAPLASGVSSDVRRGENAGRHLAHDFVALDLLHAPLQKHYGTWTATLQLPSKPSPRCRAGGVGPRGGRPHRLAKPPGMAETVTLREDART